MKNLRHLSGDVILALGHTLLLGIGLWIVGLRIAILIIAPLFGAWSVVVYYGMRKSGRVSGPVSRLEALRMVTVEIILFVILAMIALLLIKAEGRS
jgi:hypothetical protein